MVLLLSLLIQTDGVDRILRRFEEDRRKAKTKEQYYRAVDEARSALGEILRRSPRDARAAYHHAEMFLHRKEFEAAIGKMDAFVRAFPGDPNVASARLAAGEICLRLERDEEARRRFRAWDKDYPKDPRVFHVRIYLAVLDVFRQEFDRAAGALERLIRDYRGRPEEWTAAMRLAVCRQLAENRDAAMRALELVIQGCPERSAVETAKSMLAEYALLGGRLPSGKESDKRGRSFHLGAHRGKVVVLYFYTSRIPIAETEVGFLRDLHRRFSKEDLAILGVSIDQNRKAFESFRAAHNIPWSLFFDGEGLEGYLARLYRVRGIPCLRVLDRQGRVRFYNISGRDLRLAVARLAGEK